MSHSTTIQLRHQPAFGVRLTARGAAAAVSAVVWLFVLATVALALAAAVATAQQRAAGLPTRLEAPALVIRGEPARVTDPARVADPVAPEPDPAPAPGF